MLRPKDCRLGTSLIYIESFRPSRATQWDPVLKQSNNIKQSHVANCSHIGHHRNSVIILLGVMKSYPQPKALPLQGAADMANKKMNYAKDSLPLCNSLRYLQTAFYGGCAAMAVPRSYQWCTRVLKSLYRQFDSTCYSLICFVLMVGIYP